MGTKLGRRKKFAIQKPKLTTAWLVNNKTTTATTVIVIITIIIYIIMKWSQNWVTNSLWRRVTVEAKLSWFSWFSRTASLPGFRCRAVSQSEVPDKRFCNWPRSRARSTGKKSTNNYSHGISQQLQHRQQQQQQKQQLVFFFSVVVVVVVFYVFLARQASIKKSEFHEDQKHMKENSLGAILAILAPPSKLPQPHESEIWQFMRISLSISNL